MRREELFPWLDDESPVFLCQNLKDEESPAVYRVPIEHRAFAQEMDENAAARLAELPPIATFQQLKDLVGDNTMLGLFAPALIPPDDPNLDPVKQQTAQGAILLLPPSEWEEAKKQFAAWQFDGVELAFAGLPYRFEDVLVFATLNFSPDCWFAVLRGPMAGQVFWWTHDGESVLEHPWALDLRDWGRRIREEAPDAFGDFIRYPAEASPDGPPPDAELSPDRYLTPGS
ncbi:MAG: hypothetical protein AAB434_13115 [Planctomycetota bacterium]